MGCRICTFGPDSPAIVFAGASDMSRMQNEMTLVHPKTSGIHHRTRDVGLPRMVCPVDADEGATRMSETGRPSRSLPPSGAPAAAASASGAGSRERDEAGVLTIRDARSAKVPETAIINHPPHRK